MKINTVETIIDDFRNGKTEFRRPHIELLVREVSRLQSRLQQVEDNREHIERLLCDAEKRIAELDAELKNKCSTCGLAISHGIWGDEDNVYDNPKEE